MEYRELIPGKVYCFPSKTPYQITQHSAGLECFYVHMDSASFVYVREFIQAFKDRKSEFYVWVSSTVFHSALILWDLSRRSKLNVSDEYAVGNQKERSMNHTFTYKIKNKIIIMILLAVIPSILFSVYSSYQYYKDSFNRIIEEKEALVEEMTQNLDFQLKYYANISMTAYYNETILDYINGGNYSSVNENVEAYLSGIVNSESNVESVIMELGDARYVEGYRYHNMDEYLEKHRESVIEKKGKVIWIPTETMSGRYHSNLKTFALARAINSREGTVGTFWMFFSSDFISDILSYQRLNQEGTSYYIMTDDNAVVCSSREFQAGKRLGDPELIKAFENEKNGKKIRLLSDESIAVSKISEETGWKTTVIIDPDEVFGVVKVMWRMTMWLMLLSTLVLLFIYFYLTRYIFEPMKRLSTGMKNVSDKKFEKIGFRKKTDEMGMLITNYNFMIDEIMRLMSEVREEEKEKNEEKMKVLSMQINPHFVFNTLNTVKWMAISNKQTNIKCMIESLIALMKSVTYTRKDEITVEEELKLLESYVYIQKMRFVNFEVGYEVEESTKNLKILKLLLQPLVENCILHAFQGRRQGGVIGIRIYREGEILHIWVEDNGIGFDMEAQEHILAENKEESAEHVGIYNVIQRIRLNYGENYGAEIQSVPETGTRVHLILPVLESRYGGKYDQSCNN